MRSCLLVYLLVFSVTANGQRPKAVQIFTFTEYVSMFVSTGEMTVDKNGVVWVGSDDKLISFDGFHYTSYQLPEGIYPYTDHSQLGFNYQDRSGRYWAFIHNNGIYEFDPPTKKFTAFPFDTNTLQQIDVHKLTGKFLLEDSKNRVWISLNGYGLLCFATKTKEQTFYPIHDSTQFNNYVSASWLNKGIETRSGEIYFGTNQGIIQFNEGRPLLIYKDNDPRFVDGSSCIITGMALGNDDKLLLSSWGSSVKKFNTRTKQYLSFPTQPGDRSGYANIVNDITRLSDSTYFIVKRDTASQSGFGIFNSNTNRYTFFKDLEPPYVTREYFGIAKDGDHIWVMNVNQLHRFWLPGLLQNKDLSRQTLLPEQVAQPLQLYINKYWVNEEERTIPATGISLSNNENNLRFIFSCKGATQFDSVLFSYRLKGYETNWHTGYGTVAQYNSIGHGHYTFEVKIQKSPFATPETSINLSLTIAAKWWQTWWFKLLIGLSLLAILFSLYRQRIKTIQERASLKNLYEKKIAEVEMKALRAQMNPHFIFNCLNSINRYIVKSDHVTASNYLTKFSKLIRHILDNSASGIISLQTETDTLNLYVQMEAMRFENKFGYTITVDEGLDMLTTLLPSMLVQPYVENAIWHGLLHKAGGDCKLQVHFHKNGSMLEIVIEDNGIGRAKAAELKSKETAAAASRGLQITHDRLELIQNLYGISAKAVITDLYTSEGSAAGTKAIITVPLLKTQTVSGKHD